MYNHHNSFSTHQTDTVYTQVNNIQVSKRQIEVNQRCKNVQKIYNRKKRREYKITFRAKNILVNGYKYY